MKYGSVPGINKPVSRIAQGTMMLKSAELDASFALLDAVFAEGCNTFDTAHIYGRGDCERVFGQWVARRGIRDRVVVLGKGAHPYEGRNRVTDFDIKHDVHDSLARFKFDFMDLYLLHRDDPAVPVGPIVEVLNELHAQGKIGVFGGSNWTHRRIEEANEYAAKHGLKPFGASSPNFMLAEQVAEPWAGCVSIAGPAGKEAREWYAMAQMPLFTWSTLANGFFSGRLKSDHPEAAAEVMPKSSVTAYCSEANFQRLARAERMAAEKGLTVPQIALAFVMSHPLNLFALIGCRNGEEMRANAAALDCRLTEKELAWLDLRSDEP